MEKMGTSDVKVSEVTAFFRYLVPGISLVVLTMLAVPWQLLSKVVNSMNGSIAAVMFTSAFILSGWMLYHLVHQIWVGLLGFLHLYPRSRVRDYLQEMIKTTDFKPRDFWSFFLWDHCNDSVRERVKSLANYGHSLYMVSFSFFIFPLSYVASKLLFRSETTLARIFEIALSSPYPNLILFLEFLAIAFSLLIATIFLYEGYQRIQYAENIQWLILCTRRDEVSRILKKKEQQIP